MQNLKPLASLCRGTGRFESYPVENPRDVAQILFCYHSVIFVVLLQISGNRTKMSRDMTKPTKWLCAQRRLRSAWASAQSDQSLRCPHLGPKKAWVLSYPISVQRRLWSDWADAQADLSLCWAHSYFVGFDKSRLKSWCEKVQIFDTEGVILDEKVDAGITDHLLFIMLSNLF